MTRKLTFTNVVFALILVGYAIYAAVFIYLTSFVVEGQRYFTLFDDAMISMTFAKNLAHGFGPVWNPGGERIEGFTNPLWVGFMALFHLLPIAASKISLLIQIAGGLFFMASLYFVKKIAGFLSQENPWVVLLSVLVVGFYYPFSNWSLLGNEVSVLILIITAGAWLAIRQTQSERFSAGVYILMGISTMVRVDMAVPYIVLWAFLAFFDRANRRKHLLWGGGLLAAFLVGQTLVRYAYYGDILPNTYYLKMTGMSTLLRLKRGLYVFAKFAWNLGPILFLLPLLVVIFRRDRLVLLLGLLFLAQVAYSIYVGGDAWEHRGGANRFISLGMPFFLILFTYTVADIVRVLGEAAKKSLSGKAQSWTQPLANLTLLLFVGLSLVNFNTLLDGNSLSYWLLLKPSIFAPGSERYTRDALLLKKVTAADAKIAVAAAGNTIYYVDRTGIDIQGKVDKVIAREPAHPSPKGEDLTFLQPGHLKWDYARSIGELKPDVIVDLVVNTLDQAAPYLADYTPIKLNGHTMYFRTQSPSILWDQLNLLKEP